MSVTTLFNQDCPICGRQLRISVDLLGQSVLCLQCHGCFVACDASHSASPRDTDSRLLERVEQLLARCQN